MKNGFIYMYMYIYMGLFSSVHLTWPNLSLSVYYSPVHEVIRVPVLSDLLHQQNPSHWNIELWWRVSLQKKQWSWKVVTCYVCNEDIKIFNSFDSQKRCTSLKFYRDSMYFHMFQMLTLDGSKRFAFHADILCYSRYLHVCTLQFKLQI